MNHLQLLSICSSFNFKWPDSISNLFKSGDAVMATTDLIFSFDCQLDLRKPEEIDVNQFEAGLYELRVYYMKMIMMGCLPPLIALLVSLFWSAVLKKSN